MDNREKVIKGLECCGKGNMCRSHCPYDGPENDIKNCTSQLAMDALSLLKAQEPHVITKDDFSRCDDFGYIPAVFEPRDMMTFMNWEWHLVTINALSGKEGRYWSGLPSEEQREEVKWND